MLTISGRARSVTASARLVDSSSWRTMPAMMRSAAPIATCWVCEVGLTPDDVRHWDLGVISQLFESAAKLHGSHHQLGEALQNGQQRIQGWDGESGEAARAELNKTRVDVDASGFGARATSNAVRAAEMDISGAKVALDNVDSTAASFGWKVTDNWTIDTTSGTSIGLDEQTYQVELQQAQNELDDAKAWAEQGDQKLAAAVRAAVGDGPPASGPQPNDQAPGTTTPPDQLPLTPKDGHKASPTEGTARHDGPPKGSDYLSPYEHPSPLLAGLSAAEWRQRLAHFTPGDPLPDPRTPTGDKAIDSLANAAGQQNSTYAWGGNRSVSGPSPGQSTDKDSRTFDDQHRIGYDCGGLVRYSVQQGAGFDVGQGTGAIDSSPQFPHPKDLMQTPSAGVGAKALPGDVLLFTSGTGHTGIYIGNGFMINAPQSGDPVRVDAVGPGRGPTDILRIPSP